MRFSHLVLLAIVVALIGMCSTHWRRKPKVGIVIAMSLKAQKFINHLGLTEVHHCSLLWSIQPNHVYKGEYNRIKYKLVTNGLTPWMDPTLKVEMVGETSAMISTTILLNGFKPNLIVSASTMGGWSNHFNVGDMGICANGNTIPYSNHNVSVNTGYLVYRWGHFPCTTVVPQSVMQALNVKHALIMTHHSFVAPPDKAAHITTKNSGS
jgi:hypothetical protein